MKIPLSMRDFHGNSDAASRPCGPGDRLIAAAAWSERQSLEQALLVADLRKERIDWKQLDEFVIHEGIRDEEELREFYRKVGQPLPE